MNTVGDTGTAEMMSSSHYKSGKDKITDSFGHAASIMRPESGLGIKTHKHQHSGKCTHGGSMEKQEMQPVKQSS